MATARKGGKASAKAATGGVKAAPLKSAERQLGDYLTRLIYAHFDDITRDWTGPERYSPYTCQSYANLCKDKDDQNDVKAIFTLSDPSKQFLAYLFGRLIAEIANTNMTDDETVQSFRAKIIDANAESYVEFMCRFSDSVISSRPARMGPTLTQTRDSTMWFHNQFVGQIAGGTTKMKLCALISSEFDNFMHACALSLGSYLWYAPGAITENMFLGWCAQQGITRVGGQIMLDEMQNSLRAKPAPKPKAAKKPDDTKPDTKQDETKQDETKQDETKQDTKQDTKPAETVQADPELAAMLETI